jgi:NAD(P)-dependent dehydrogenase (short-subunit alcohol dehydrogenase family)
MAKARKEANREGGGGSAGGANLGRAAKLHFIQLDLASLASVRTFVQRFRQTFSNTGSDDDDDGSGKRGGGSSVAVEAAVSLSSSCVCDVLVLNAGLNTGGTTGDGLEQRWQVNYLGHWLLASELLPEVAAAGGPCGEGGRVVCLSSVMHHLGDEGNFEAHCEVMSSSSSSSPSSGSRERTLDVYSDSKLAMNLLALDLQRRFSDSATASAAAGGSVGSGGGSGRSAGIVGPKLVARAVAVNPGAVASDIWRGVPWLLRKVCLDPLMALVFLNPDEGCATSVHAATQPLPPPTSSVSSPASSTTTRSAAVPYYVPYWVPAWSSLPFEAAGPFMGARLAPQRLPANAGTAARLLWDLSERTVREIKDERDSSSNYKQIAGDATHESDPNGPLLS